MELGTCSQCDKPATWDFAVLDGDFNILDGDRACTEHSPPGVKVEPQDYKEIIVAGGIVNTKDWTFAPFEGPENLQLPHQSNPADHHCQEDTDAEPDD